MPDVIVLDTCVLISNVLRRLLLRLAGRGCFQVAWSPIIGDEWRRNAARLWKVTDSEIQAQWYALQCEFPKADQGDISTFKTGLHRSDPKDWHVIAAARAVQSRDAGLRVAIVTRNIKDFNRSELRAFGLGLYEPDQLLVKCWQAYPQIMTELFRELPEDALASGKEPEALDVILKRERLFRLNKLCA